MKLSKLHTVVMAAAAVMATSCMNDTKSTWDQYETWRNSNQKWVQAKADSVGADGKKVFTPFSPDYNPQAKVYYRHLDSIHTQNLQPYYTSTVSVNYEVHLMDGTRIDRGTGYQATLSSQSLIPGWGIAIGQMHVGDSIEAILPYNVAYGAGGSGLVLPYSALRFNIRLVDIPYYEVRP